MHSTLIVSGMIAQSFVNKNVSFILALFILLNLVSPAFAEESSAGDSASSSETSPTSDPNDANAVTENNFTPPTSEVTETIDTTVDGSSQQNVGSPEAITGSPAEGEDFGAMMDSPMGGAGGGETLNAAKFSTASINESDGSFTYRLPLKTPPGRNGIEPHLSLTYNSNSGSDHDLFGYGWSIDIPYIQRLNKKGIDALYDVGQSYYFSSLTGELVQVGTSSSYKSKVETGQFLGYTFSNNKWVATDKNGVTYTFGSTTASQMNNSASTTQIYKWMINEIRDTNNNYISFSYTKDKNQIYPDQIFYTGSGIADGTLEVDFSTEDGNSSFPGSFAGFSATTSKRISRIEMQIENSVVHAYDLEYIAGDDNKRNILSYVTEESRVGGTTTYLPPLEFDYQTTMSTGWSEDNSWLIPDGFVSGSGYDLGTRFVDVNGDGYIDILRYFKDNDSSWSVKALYLHDTINTWVLDNTFNWNEVDLFFTELIDASGSGNPKNDQGTRFSDVNGDGLTDVLVGHDHYNSANDKQEVLINNGSGWYLDTSWTLPVYFTRYNGNYSFDTGARITEVNGDGLPDIIEAYFDDNNVLQESVYINNGTGWSLSTEWEFPEPFTKCWSCTGRGTDLGTRLVDLNSDGLVDVMRGISDDEDFWTKNITYINSGTGWATSSLWSAPDFVEFNGDPEDQGYRFGDVNGDGLVDIVQNTTAPDPDQIDLLINTGSGWDSTIGTIPATEMYFVNSIGTQGTYLVDINGDGLDDLIHSEGVPDATTTNAQRVYLNDRNNADKLTKITTPQGGEISLAYKGSAEYKDGSGDLLNPNLPNIVLTVSSTTYNSKFGNIWNEQYEYEGGKIWFDKNYQLDRRFSGYNIITKTDDLSENKTYYHQGTTTDTANGEFEDSYSKIGMPYRVEVSDSSSNIYKLTTNRWEETDLGNNARFAKRTNTLTLDYDGDSDHKDSAVAYTYDNNNGSVTKVTEYGEVTGNTNGTFTDSGTDKRTLSYTYATTTDGMALVSSSKLQDYSTSTVSETKSYYDNQVFGVVTKGNLTKKSDWITGSTYADTQWSYNSYGLPASTTDPNNKITSYSYDSRNLYVATTTNPLSQTTFFEYDYAVGKVSTTTDSNGKKYITSYDGLGRPLSEKIPDPQTGSTVVKSEYVYVDTSGSVSLNAKNYLNSATTTDVYEYFDGFNRKLQARGEAETANQYVVRDFVYGENGLLEKESLPYFSTGSSKTSPTATTDLYTEYQYDPLTRKMSVATVVGTTNTVYDDWNETVTDTESNQKAFSFDAFKRLSGVTEYSGTSTYNTVYKWTSNDKLATVTDALGNFRTITYDGMGRRLTLGDLHAVGDSTFGVWTFAYDLASNLSTTTNPKGQTIVNTYDAINRPLSENFTGQSGTELTYAYDSCTNGKGRLCSIRGFATSSQNYTPLGLLEVASTTIGTTTYTVSYDYDRQGNQIKLNYPDNSSVEYIYNTAGGLEKADFIDTDSTRLAIVTDFDYGPHGLITYQQFGNGASTTKTYDEGELYRLRSIITSTAEQVGNAGNEHALIEAGLYVDESGQLIYGDSSESPGVVDNQEITSSDFGVEGDETGEVIVPEIIDVVNETEDTAVSTSSSEQTDELVSPEAFETTGTDIGEEEQSTTTISEIESTLVSELISTTTVSSTTQPLTAKQIEAEALISLLKEKNQNDRANYKADLVVSKTKIGEFEKDGYLINIDSIEKIDNGLQVFAKAWKKDKQLGFGKDGQVEIERFEIFNPPLLVPDENGEVLIEYVTASGETGIRTLTVDPEEALRQVLTHNVSLAGKENANIEFGSVGSTTSTFYPSADGYIEAYATSGNTSFSNLVNGTGVSFYEDDTISSDWAGELTAGHASNQWYHMARGFFLFDTSALPDADTVATATLSIYGAYKYNGLGGTLDINVFSSNPASTTALAATAADYNSIGSTAFSTALPYSSWQNGAYNDFVLNAEGIAAITATGTSKFSTRVNHDYNNTAPTWVNGETGRFDPYYAEVAGTTQDPKLVVTHAEGPTSPSSLLLEGQSSPATSSDPLPEFSAIFNHTATGSLASYYQIEVSTSSSFVPSKWDSEKTALPYTLAIGERSPDISYAGMPLSTSTTYYWRIKFWDNNGTEGDWSTSTPSFVVTATFNNLIIQNLDYNYDTVGNITQLVDTSNTQNAVTTLYTYDDLYRLLSASTTAAASSPYLQTYTYSSIGNLTNKSDVGSYTYAGTNYANPHAATTIGGTAASYDTNGNLVAFGSNVYGWNYRNRLASSTVGSTTSTYAYDHEDRRLRKTSGTDTTNYPFPFYEVTNTGTTTKHIYAGDVLLSSVESGAPGGGSTDSGLKTTGTVETNTGWSNLTTNALNTSDNSYATCDATCDNSDNGQTSDYSFNLPGGSTINGIEVKVEASEAVSSGNIPLYVSLSWNDGANFTSTKTATVDGTTDATYTLGGSTDTWGRSWTTGELANGVFRAKFDKAASTDTLRLDLIQIKVYYQNSTTTASTTLNFIHPDHLNSTNVVTSETGYTTQVLSYYPFGDTRIDNQYGGYSVDRQFTGHIKDAETDLNYMGSRYQDGSIGKFISQDKANLDLGASHWENTYGRPVELILRDPQQLNTYSYARNNPINVTDPGGDILPLLAAIAFAGLASFAADVNYAYAPNASTDLTNAPVGTNPLIPGYDNMSSGQKMSLEIAFMAFGKPNPSSLVRHGDDFVSVFRGGSGNNLFNLKPGEIKVDKNGFVSGARGVSLNTNAASLDKFGGANRIESLPDTLSIKQYGKDPNHYEIVPTGNLTPKEFQSELNKIKTKRVRE